MRRAASNPDLGLVAWPPLNPDDDKTVAALPWRDTGEGGLYVYALWEHPEANDRCVVDHIVTLRAWDSTAGIHGPMASDIEVASIESYERTREARAAFDKSGAMNDAREAFEAEFPLWGVGPVLYLGSTPHALHFETPYDTGYFQVVGHGQLTEKGSTLVAAMESVYGPATYLTLLDT